MMADGENETQRTRRFWPARVEAWSSVGALALATAEATYLLRGGAIHLKATNAAGFFVGVFLGPLLAIMGAWIDIRRGQALGLLLIALGVLLALDGVIATFLLGLPSFLLVLLSFAASISRRRGLQSAFDDSSPR